MSERKAYAIKASNGKWMGHKRFTYARGKHDTWSTNFQSARLFNREQDANRASLQPVPSSVITLTVTEDVT